MLMTTVRIVNQCVRWVNLLTQLIENAKQDVYHYSSTISNVCHYVQQDIMLTQQAIVCYQVYAIPVCLMVRMVPQSVFLLAVEGHLLIQILITVLLYALKAGMVILIHVIKHVKPLGPLPQTSLKHVEVIAQN